MKSPIIPVICGISLAAMSSAVFSHWWTLRETIAADSNLTLPPAEEKSIEPIAPMPEIKANSFARSSGSQALPMSTEVAASQKEFYEGLIAEMRKLRTENRDLRDQMAETNRSVMNLEFRVDTHSESFRPLPVSEERPDTTDTDLTPNEDGVLPPRAQPVASPLPLPSRKR